MRGNIFVKSIEICLLEHLDDPAIYRYLYGHLCKLGSQYIDGKAWPSLGVSIPNDDKTYVLLFII